MTNIVGSSPLFPFTPSPVPLSRVQDNTAAAGRGRHRPAAVAAAGIVVDQQPQQPTPTLQYRSSSSSSHHRAAAGAAAAAAAAAAPPPPPPPPRPNGHKPTTTAMKQQQQQQQQPQRIHTHMIHDLTHTVHTSHRHFTQANPNEAAAATDTTSGISPTRTTIPGGDQAAHLQDVEHAAALAVAMATPKSARYKPPPTPTQQQQQQHSFNAARQHEAHTPSSSPTTPAAADVHTIQKRLQADLQQLRTLGQERRDLHAVFQEVLKKAKDADQPEQTSGKTRAETTHHNAKQLQAQYTNALTALNAKISAVEASIQQGALLAQEATAKSMATFTAPPPSTNNGTQTPIAAARKIPTYIPTRTPHSAAAATAVLPLQTRRAAEIEAERHAQTLLQVGADAASASLRAQVTHRGHGTQSSSDSLDAYLERGGTAPVHHAAVAAEAATAAPAANHQIQRLFLQLTEEMERGRLISDALAIEKRLRKDAEARLFDVEQRDADVRERLVDKEETAAKQISRMQQCERDALLLQEKCKMLQRTAEHNQKLIEELKQQRDVAIAAAASHEEALREASERVAHLTRGRDVFESEISQLQKQIGEYSAAIERLTRARRADADQFQFFITQFTEKLKRARSIKREVRALKKCRAKTHNREHGVWQYVHQRRHGHHYHHQNHDSDSLRCGGHRHRHRQRQHQRRQRSLPTYEGGSSDSEESSCGVHESSSHRCTVKCGTRRRRRVQQRKRGMEEKSHIVPSSADSSSSGDDNSCCDHRCGRAGGGGGRGVCSCQQEMNNGGRRRPHQPASSPTVAVEGHGVSAEVEDDILSQASEFLSKLSQKVSPRPVRQSGRFHSKII